MATTKTKRLSKILHAQASSEMDELKNLAPDMVLSVEVQTRIMEVRRNLPGAREDVRFPDVWVKGDGTVVAVKDMSREHMCMAIGLWLRKEFEAKEARNLGVTRFSDSAPNVSAYDTPEVCLTASESFLTTPSLHTMLARLRGIEGGMEHLYEIIRERATESLEAAHDIPEHFLFAQPAFF